jgi:mercuric ion binding protein
MLPMIIKTSLLPLILLAMAGQAFAATQTVTLDVPTMTCATCPLTVKTALSKVDGVLEAKVTWEPKEAVVTYDDARTDVNALTEATKNAGYPSVKQTKAD